MAWDDVQQHPTRIGASMQRARRALTPAELQPRKIKSASGRDIKLCLSAACARNKCSACYSLGCTHDCHKGGH